MSKISEKKYDTRHRVSRRNRLKKLLSGFLAMSTAITMLGGSAATMMAEEPATEYALAGAGSGEEITIHFGDDENNDISIHVNPETNAETLAGLGSEEPGDETEAETETESNGIKEIEAGEIVTISPVDGSELPEEAEADAAIVQGEEAIAAVEAIVEEEDSTITPEENAADSSVDSSSGIMDEGNSVSEEAAGTAETQYQVFDISLDNVDTEKYEDGFKVSVSLPESIEGARDFHLYHLQEGEEPEEIDITTIGSVDEETGLEVVSGFEFETEGFDEFVLRYTVDFYYDVDGRTYEYHINGGSVQSLQKLLPLLGIVAEDEADDYVANIDSVSFSDETLVKPVPVTEDTTAGEIVDALDVEIDYSAKLTEKDIEAIRAREFTAPDWALVSIKPFFTDEFLTITLKNGDVVIIKVTDDPSKGYFNVNDYSHGFLKIRNTSPYNDMEYVYAGNVNNGSGRINADVTAIARSDYIFHRWWIHYADTNYENGWPSSSFRTNVIPAGSVEMDKLWGSNGRRAEIFTAEFITARRGIDVDDSSKSMGRIAVNGSVSNSYELYNGSWKDWNGKNAVSFEAVPNSGYVFDHWNYYRSSDNNEWTCTATLNDRVIAAGTFDMDRNESWFLKAVFKEPQGCITVNDWSMGYLRCGGNDYTNEMTANNIEWTPENVNKRGIVAHANSGYCFSHWTVTNTEGYTWDSGLYKKETIEFGKLEKAALADRKQKFTAVFMPVNQFTVMVASGFEDRGTYSSKYLDSNHSTGVDATWGQVFSGYGSLGSDKTGISYYKYGFGTRANEGYKFALWVYYDQDTELYKGVKSIDNGMEVPFDGITYEAYFTPNNTELIVYQSADTSMGYVDKFYGTTSEAGATARPVSEDYVFLGWFDQDGNCVSNEATFNASSVNTSMVLTAKFAERRSGNVTFKVQDGSQARLIVGGETVTGTEKTVHMNESGNGKLEVEVVAEPGNNDSFLYWELNRGGNTLRLSYDSATIGEDSWLVFQDGDEMTACFDEGRLKDYNSSETATSDIVISDEKKRELQQWLESLKNSHTASADKTARVYDYDNRIYQIDITAESSLMDFEADIDLAFIIDVSNSMLFPSKLVKNKNEMILTQDNLNKAYPDGSTHYIISDPTGTSTAYRIFRADDGIWYYVDASLGNEQAHKVVWDCRYSEPAKDVPFRYPIYDAVGDRRRVDYLNDSLQSAIDSLHSILENFSTAGGTTHDIKLAYNTFAASTYFHTSENPFIFQDFQSMKGNPNLSISVRDTGGGTRQDLALEDARRFSWDVNHKKYAILITDGAPVVGSKGSIDQKDIDTIRSNIGTEATNLKNQDVTLITVGLSTQNVYFGSNKLKEIASQDPNGAGKLFFQAEHADDLEGILLDILRRIMNQKTVAGEVTDVIDEAFYPVDQSGKPISEGMYLNDGTPIGYNERVDEPRYEWKKVNNNWVITYYNQEFGPDEAWKKTVLVKAKEDFLGGNTIPTNVNASVQPKWYLDENRQKHEYSESSISLPKPYVNVDELSLTKNDTEWTVYLGTEVDPKEQLQKLFNEILVNEVVTQTADGAHVIMAGADATLYPIEKSDVDGRAAKNGAVPETFQLSKVAPLTEDDWTSLINGQQVIKPYSAYTHDAGNIIYTLTQTVMEKEDGLNASRPHNTAVVGQNVEQYTLTARYVPAAETTPSDGWHTTPGGTRGVVTGNMESENTHRIHVFAKLLTVKKMDSTLENSLKGAEFTLYSPTDTPQAEDVLNINNADYVPASDPFVVGDDGVAEIGLIRALDSGSYYLVETKAPDGYVAAEPIKVTLTISDTFDEVPGGSSGLTEKPSIKPYNWRQAASLILDGAVSRSDENWNNNNETPVPDSAAATIYYRIPNSLGIVLPETGGSGTLIYYIAGTVLVLLALALLLHRRRKAF